MTPEWSRRIAALKFAPIILALELPERFAFFDRCTAAKTIKDLSDADRDAFLRAELEVKRAA